MLPISTDVVRSELEGVKSIIEKWLARLDQGIPGVEVPAPEDRTEAFLRELCGELMVSAGKCENVASILSEGTR